MMLFQLCRCSLFQSTPLREGRPTFITFPEYLSYYKKDFHPSEIDYTDIVAHWKKKLAVDYQMESFQENEQPAMLYS